MPGKIRIKGRGTTATYRIEASESLSEAENSLEDAQETIHGNTATGQVSTGDDVFFYEDHVTAIDIDGDARVVVDPDPSELEAAVRTVIRDELSNAPKTDGLPPGGGIHVVGENWPYDTLQGAHDDLGDRWTDDGIVLAAPSYNPENEDYPIIIGKRCRVEAGNYTRLEPPDNKNAIVIDMSPAKNNRPPGPYIGHLTVRGGKDGVYVRNGRYTRLDDIDVNRCTGRGFATDDYDAWDDNPDNDIAINSHSWRNCIAERTGDHCFYIGERAHGTTLGMCHAYWAGDHTGNDEADGLHVADGVAAGGAAGGSFEQCNRNGIRLSGANNFHAAGIYVEANAPNVPGGSGVYVGGDTRVATFDNVYGNGFNKCERLFRIGPSHGVDIRGVRWRYYTKSMIYAGENATDVNVDRHLCCVGENDDTPFGSIAAAERPRYNGTILTDDLSTVDGKYNGDEAELLSDDEVRRAIWYNGSWH